jgi:O-antigen/teichoic acid export membrane protein
VSDIRQLVRQSSHYFGGRVGLLLLGFISFPLFTRLYSLAEYGLINLIVKVILILTAFSKLGLQNSVSRFYKEHALSPDRNALETYFSSILFGSVGISAGFAAAFAAAVAASPAWLVSAEMRPLLLLGSVLLFTGTIRSVLINFLRAEERTQLYNILEVIIKIVSIALICTVSIVSGATAKSFIKATIISEIVGLLLIVTPLIRRKMINWRRWDYTFFRKALLFGMPLIGLEVGNLLLDSGDRILVARFLGAEALGLYSAASNIAGYVQDLLMAPVTLALFPIYMNLWTARGPEATRQFLSKSLQAFLCVAIGVVAIVSATAKPAVMLLASSKFAAASSLVPMLTAGMILVATVPFFTAGLYLNNRTSTLATTTIGACIVNLGLNAVLLPWLGLMGGAIASALGYAVLLGVTAHASSKYLRLDFRPGTVLRCAIAGIAAAIPAFFINTGLTISDLAVKAAMTGGIYGVLVYLADKRVRMMGDELLQWVRRTPVSVGSQA